MIICNSLEFGSIKRFKILYGFFLSLGVLEAIQNKKSFLGNICEKERKAHFRNLTLFK